MITKAQAISANEFHLGECVAVTGPRGGVTIRRTVWRRNGRTKTWKTRPNDWLVPVKYSLSTYNHITQDDAVKFHTTEDCPL